MLSHGVPRVTETWHWQIRAPQTLMHRRVIRRGSYKFRERRMMRQEFLEAFETYGNDYLNVAKQICRITLGEIDHEQPGFTDENIETMIEADTVLDTIFTNWDAAPVNYVKTSSPNSKMAAIYNAIQKLTSDIEKIEAKEQQSIVASQVLMAMGKQFHYEFSQGDIERVQQLVNELRNWLVQCGDITEEHRQRILRRLERLQAEIHKKTSDLDRLWGLIGDAGVALGKFGKEAKPFVDRIRELTQIAWRTQSRAEELPSSSEPPQIGWDQGAEG